MFQPVPIFVGLRYSLAREHSFFVSFITWVSLLGVAFIVLKLCKVIVWSWWWVTAPFWVPAAIGLVIVGVLVLIGITAAILAAIISK